MLQGGLAVVLAAAGTAGLGAAELHDETIAAWQRYVEATEQRIPFGTSMRSPSAPRVSIRSMRTSPARTSRRAPAASLPKSCTRKRLPASISPAAPSITGAAAC